ncbi:MAG: phage tail protein [Candidatus Lokiarchaeota archaeon]|nr:phage tail protein [Candidatus Lokiarchaeota archaeon]
MEDYYYDRTRNLSGINYVDLTGFCPSYGMQVTFRAKNDTITYDNNYFSKNPKTINSVTAEFSLSYDVNEKGAQEIANNLESLSGQNSFVFKTDNVIYKDLSGYCDGYGIQHVNQDSYTVNTNIFVDEAPNLFNWKNTNFIEYTYKEWSDGETYEQDDVIYYNNSEIQWDNFYYCTGDHVSSASNSPTGASTAWSQEFYWQPDVNMQNNVNFTTAKFNGVWEQRMKTKKHIALVPLSYTFAGISKKQLLTMLHFLELKGGYRRFRHQIPTVYNKPKIYICNEWVHKWNNPESHDLTVSFEEDPLGIMPKNVPVGGTIPRKIVGSPDTFFGGFDGGFDEPNLPTA